MAFAVDLSCYAGPIDLLLFLIRREEFDVSVVSLSQLTHQFLDYLEVLQELDMDGVGDFLEIASILIEMKAKEVLPTDPVPTEEEDAVLEDPADQLVQRLIQYKRYRDAAVILDEQSRRWQMRYARLADDLPTRRNDPSEQPIADLEIWDLVSAFGRVLRENRPVAPANVIYDETPIHLHMQRIHAKLKNEKKLELQELFPMGAHKSHLVGLFLATLELTRHHGVLAQQAGDGGAIVLVPGPAFVVDLEVAEIDNLDSEKIARSNMPIRPR